MIPDFSKSLENMVKDARTVCYLERATRWPAMTPTGLLVQLDKWIDVSKLNISYETTSADHGKLLAMTIQEGQGDSFTVWFYTLYGDDRANVITPHGTVMLMDDELFEFSFNLWINKP